ncbi:MAG TPA: DUF1361 domain-containing protein [Puia sp.]|nr:DUF1361 domain-containing protein [Puia sp.]
MKNLLSSPTYRIFSLRTEMEKLIMLSILFSCGLIVTRIFHTGRLTFVFLVWNLFLASVPYFFTNLLTSKPGWTDKKPLVIFFFLVWLLCVPNAFYILTDLFHLGDKHNETAVPLWYDLVLILSFAWNALLLGILSVRQMEKILLRHASWKHELFFLYPVMWVNALGIYTGRYLRYNTWDVIANPFQLIHDIGHVLIHPFVFHDAWGMIFCFSVLMTLIYLTLKNLALSFPRNPLP